MEEEKKIRNCTDVDWLSYLLGAEIAFLSMIFLELIETIKSF